MLVAEVPSLKARGRVSDDTNVFGLRGIDRLGGKCAQYMCQAGNLLKFEWNSLKVES